MNGILLLDKPEGPTSADCVFRIRRALAERLGTKPRDLKVGHGGTLDPFATGLSVILIGQATKLSDLFLLSKKSYKAVLRVGLQTNSGDLQGEITAEKEIPSLDLSAWQKLADRFVQEPYDQVPPMFSAKKMDGIALHTLARQNIEIERQAIRKRIDLFEVHAPQTPLPPPYPFLHLAVTCESGTYVRVLAEDLAKAAGTLGHLTQLRRTESGGFSVSDAVPLDQACDFLQNKQRDLSTLPWFKSIHDVTQKFPSLDLDAAEARDVSQGKTVTIQKVLERMRNLDSPYVLAKRNQVLVALFEKIAPEKFRLQRVFTD